MILIIGNSRREHKTFKIIDCETGTDLITFEVKDLEIIGRIKSGIFKLVDGHFYFGNKVYKIRYDLLEGEGKASFNEKNMFDKYDQLLDLKSKEKI